MARKFMIVPLHDLKVALERFYGHEWQGSLISTLADVDLTVVSPQVETLENRPSMHAEPLDSLIVSWDDPRG